jgi:hypothetical protein
MDIVNMSLGSTYGQPFDDDLSAAVDGATASRCPDGCLCWQLIRQAVCQWNPRRCPHGPIRGADQRSKRILATDADCCSGKYRWQLPGCLPALVGSADESVIEAPVQYGDGAGGNLLGCDPFAPGTFAGKIGLVDRGGCNFTLKIKNIAEAGGLVGIIGLVAPGDPFEGGDGGDRPIDIPGYMISQAASNRLKSGLPNTVVRFDPAVGIPLVGTIVGSSSRGPQHESTTLIKPEIGAPGASISAIAGTGTGEGPFGGTSGAAPMVTGSAALVLQGYGGTVAPSEGQQSRQRHWSRIETD